MSLKKRMFRSNMVILICAFAALVMAAVLVLGMFEDSLEKQLPDTHWIKHSIISTMPTLAIAGMLISLLTIGALLILSVWFTNRMNRKIMDPLDELVKAAQRIQEGNLTEEIRYQGEAEFEKVCRTFNAMQKTILKDQEQRRQNEKARTDMVTGISHDLRTPLTSIQGYIKGILDGIAATPEKQKAYLETAYESTREMNVLLQKLFDFSRMESGQMPFRMVQTDLSEFTVSYIAQKETTYDSGEVLLTVDCNADEKEIQDNRGIDKEENTVRQKPGEDIGSHYRQMPEISIDVEQVRRIFDNLLENSIKYAGTKPVQIYVTVREETESVVLEWKDNGTGVPEEKLDKIFDRFYRCDESRRQKGSGVGLYVVKYIMERHHGTVHAFNDHGLKMQLYFPKEQK